MNKYQKALDNFVKSTCNNSGSKGCQNCSIKDKCNSFAKEWIETIQELINRSKNNGKIKISDFIKNDKIVIKCQSKGQVDRVNSYTNIKPFNKEKYDWFYRSYMFENDPDTLPTYLRCNGGVIFKYERPFLNPIHSDEWFEDTDFIIYNYEDVLFDIELK